MMMRSRWTPMGAIVLALLLSGCDALTTPHYRLEQARAELEKGDWGRAAVRLHKLVQTDPNNAEAWVLLARLSVDVGVPAEAQSEINRAMKAGAQGPELDQQRVRTWLALGKPNAVIDAAAHHTLTIPEPDRTVAIARAYNALQHPDRALAVLQPLIATHVGSADARLAAAEAYAREGRIDLALKQTDAAVAVDHNDWEALRFRGELLQSQGHLPEAEAALALATQRMPASAPMTQRAETLVELTDVRLWQNKLEEGSQSDKLLEKVAPEAPVTQMLAGRLKLMRGDYEGGTMDLERAISRAPNFAQAQMLLASAQFDRGNLEQAQTNLEQVLQEVPGNVSARKLLAEVRLRLNEPQDALIALTPAFGAQAMDPQLYALLEAVENQVGSSNFVLLTLERSLKAHPDNGTLRLNLAAAYLSANRPKDALTLLEAIDDRADDPRRDALLLSAVEAIRGPVAAGTEADKLLAAHPHDAGVLNVAASFFLGQRQYPRARVLLLEAVSANPRDASALLNLARLEAETGDVAAAQNTLQRALDADSGNLGARIALADLLVARKDFDQARQLLEASSDPRAPDVQFALAGVALARGDVKQANAALDRAAAQQRGSAELEDRAGRLLYSARQYDSALTRFTKATEKAPDNGAFWYDAARAQLALNQTLAASQSLEKASELQPEWVPPVRELVLLDLRAKNYDSAVRRVDQLVAKQPDNTDALILQGDVQQALGQFRQAVATYQEALRRRPAAAMVEKLYEARSRAKLPQPEQPLQEWLSEHPNDPAIRNVLGDYYLAQRQLRQAAQQFEAVLERTPNDVESLNNLAWTYSELQDRRAEGVAEQAYKLAPEAPSVDDTLGWILARTRATDRALRLLGQAVKLNANDPEMQYHYAYALAQAGKRAQARELLSKALAGKHDAVWRRDAERLLANLRE